ncbi:M28 family peptidase [Sandaracinobacter neustonicus]|uniref:M28 family peptidase n=1 Tax=Sandaracinobacter neustonicus TaxID=1715348 RepID=A0A501XMC1_9SPHN|nr:M28 family metallopeptidase [Sandaracinobacter neustonicus]TPE61585.1 M28 family peptidase [Sandaracinobacter neustonicus]
MRHLLLASILLLSAPALADTAGDRWFSHVKVLADDNMEGRLTGTPGYDRAAAYVAEQFAKLGLQPAGTDGYLQSVALTEQTLNLPASKLALDGAPLQLGEQVLPGNRVPQMKGPFDAELVFIGSGLHLPEAGHDDFAGIDLKGKIAVVLASGPARISGALKSHARSAELWPAMQRAGAIGLLNIANPNQMDVPWARQKLFANTPGMRLSDPALNDAKQPFFTGSFSPAEAGMLFAKSGHSFADMVKLADAGAELPRFPLNRRLAGEIAAVDRQLTSPNVVGLLPGRDRKLKSEYVVLTAHLDHLGVGQPVNGDAIYNGAMDNASGIASMIETGRALKAKKPKRSVLLVAVTAEERGLLGSRYFANRPTVPADAIVANINMDMYLPLWPFTHVTALGAEESSLGLVSARAAREVGATQVPDEAPERNLFVRSDQYSFVRTGVPALALKFASSNPEQQAIQKDWLTNRYHAPSDDLSQPINPAYAVTFNRYLERLILSVADQPERPRWNEESFFKRFAKAPPAAQ